MGVPPVGEVVVVAGPPGAGKSHYIRAHATPGDIVIDYDDLLHALTGTHRTREGPAPAMARAAYNGLTRALRVAPGASGRAWVTHTAPKAAARDRWRRTHRATVVVVATPVEDCIRQIRGDPTRPSASHPWLTAAARAWWDEYEPDPRDHVITPGDEPPQLKTPPASLPRGGRAPQGGGRAATHGQPPRRRTGPRHTGRPWERTRKKVIKESDVCALCGQPVDKSLTYPDPGYPTVDLITPLSQGGSWKDEANLQLAHLGCNSAARDKVPGRRSQAFRKSQAW